MKYLPIIKTDEETHTIGFKLDKFNLRKEICKELVLEQDVG